MAGYSRPRSKERVRFTSAIGQEQTLWSRGAYARAARARLKLRKAWLAWNRGSVPAYALWRASLGVAPEPLIMGTIGVLALAVNAGVAILLFRFREGDANMRSVWLCTRNDVIANLAVLIASVGVLGTGSMWPDVAVAMVLALLGITSGRAVIHQARSELGAA